MFWWTVRKLKGRNPESRLKAIEMLSRSRDPRANGWLLAAAFRSGGPYERFSEKQVRLKEQHAAIKALGKLRDSRAMPHLLNALREGELAYWAADALSCFEEVPTAPLVALLVDEKLGVRPKTSVMELLGKLGWKPGTATESAWFYICQR
jgi:hypothetical protein